jgi:hypothetical protein
VLCRLQILRGTPALKKGVQISLEIKHVTSHISFEVTGIHALFLSEFDFNTSLAERRKTKSEEWEVLAMLAIR